MHVKSSRRSCLTSLRSGGSACIRSKISDASGQSGPEHSTSVLTAQLVPERPPQSTVDEPALDPEDDVPEETRWARRSDGAPHSSSGGRITLEKTRDAARTSRE